MELSEIMEVVYEEYIANGYWEMWTTDEEHQPIYNLAEVGLFHTEAAETQEGVRKTNYTNVAEECADIVIRVMNFCSRMDIDLEDEILKKNVKNLTRGIKHGKDI